MSEIETTATELNPEAATKRFRCRININDARRTNNTSESDMMVPVPHQLSLPFVQGDQEECHE